MSLERGKRLGPYEILGALGAGGMGEVYKARDTRLDRTVAIKVLSTDLARDPTLKERFEREARAVSSLNHPHICTLHDIGSDSGIDYMVMEHLEGETLASRLERGALPVADVLRTGVQIADALDKAHRRGLVHRDLKPGNIFLTREGAKLLDFGLARSSGSGSVISRTADETPTMTVPLTAAGTIIGTFSYMAPEQLEGDEADARSDIFAFGVVLYEMLAGQRAFPGKNPASIIAAILKEEPRPLSDLAPSAPTALQRIIRTCLSKDPEHRHQSIHDLKLALQWIAEAGPDATPPAAEPRRGMHPGWIAAGVLAAAALAGWWIVATSWRATPSQPAALRFTIPQPEGTTLSGHAASEPDLAISPDGRALVFVGVSSAGVGTLWLRQLDSSEAYPIPGTEGGQDPFWSPDGRFIGFFAEGKLRKAPIQAGPVQAICDAPDARGGAWSPSGLILVGSRTAGSGIMGVPDSGGTLRPITTVPPEEGVYSHQWPDLLPDGRRFLFLSFTAGRGTRTIRMGSLDAPEVRTIAESEFPADYLDPGYLMHLRGGALVAQPFSPATGALSGEPILVTEKLATASIPGMVNFDVAPGGVIVWRRAQAVVATQMTWVDRAGRRTETVGEPSGDVSLSLSDDGTRAAVGRIIPGVDWAATGELPTDVWVVDLQRRVASRATFTPQQNDENPLWTPDGEQIIFASHRDGPSDVYRKSASGMGEENLVFRSSGADADRFYMGLNAHPIDVSPDGRLLMLHVVDAADNLDLAVMPTDGSAPPERFAPSTFHEAQGQFSPDGLWVAYTSNESGVFEVYVQPYPPTGGKWRISSAGGGQPRWRRDGREIFYVDPQGSLMAAPVTLRPAFTAGSPVALIHAQFQPTNVSFYGGAANYDVSPDGQRFLFNRMLEDQGSTPIEVLVNWRP